MVWEMPVMFVLWMLPMTLTQMDSAPMLIIVLWLQMQIKLMAIVMVWAMFVMLVLLMQQMMPMVMARMVRPEVADWAMIRKTRPKTGAAAYAAVCSSA